MQGHAASTGATMTVKPTVAGSSSVSAGAVLLWCALAAAAVSGVLLCEPPEGRGLEFLTPAGALRLLADLAIFHVLFLIPLFAWRKDKPLRASLEAAGVAALTVALGLVILNNLVGLDAATLAKLIGFVALSVAGAVAWAEALRARPAVYYGCAAIFALGIPLVAFFAGECFRVEAAWVAWLSPFTAWRAIVDAGAWAPWALFGADLAVGVAWLVISRRRANA